MLLLLCSALFSCALLVCVWVSGGDLYDRTVSCHTCNTVGGGLVHVVEGERDHKVWSLTSIVHTHTYSTPSSPDRWCFALTVCVDVCQSEGQHHQSARCTQQPFTLTPPHIHMLAQRIFFLIFTPKARIVTNATQTTRFFLQGQTVGPCVFMCFVRVVNVL